MKNIKYAFNEKDYEQVEKAGLNSVADKMRAFEKNYAELAELQLQYMESLNNIEADVKALAVEAFKLQNERDFLAKELQSALSRL